jgi:hypothetical protein
MIFLVKKFSKSPSAENAPFVNSLCFNLKSFLWLPSGLGVSLKTLER